MNHHDSPIRARLTVRHALPAIIALLALLAHASLLRADAPESSWTTAEENWYVIEMADTPAGWSRTVKSVRGNQYRMQTRLEMHIRRGDASVEIVTEESFTETADGRPIRMTRTESPGEGEIAHEWHFGKDRVTHIIRQHGRETKRELPSPEGVWLTPRAARQFLATRRAAGAKHATYRTISPDSGITPITVTTRHLRDEEYELDSRTLPVTVWQSTTDHLPVPVTEFIAADGVVLRQEVEVGTNRMVMRLATREHVERLKAELTTGDVPEIVLANLVKPDRPIERPFDTRRTVLRVRVTDGDTPEFPTAGAQRASTVDGDDRAVVLTIDVDEPVPQPLGDAARAGYLAASSLIDHQDEAVRELARVRERDRPDPMRVAESLRRRVHRHITLKTLDTGFASASETARSQQGDCTEHAVLLTALFRANGIPARIATGLIYAEQFADRKHVFGWHMWAQAWIDGAWWDFDAVLPDRRFHAGYVLISSAALSDDRRYEGMDSLMTLLGNIEISVVEVTHR
jgi:hypothetical protein